jgi:integrase
MTIYLALSKRIDANTEKEIRMRFKHGKIDLQAKTNIFIPPEYADNGKKVSIWSKETQQIVVPKFRTRTPEKDKFIEYLTAQNEKLNMLISTIKRQFNEADRSTIGRDWLKVVIDKFNFPEKYLPKEKVTPSVFEFVESFIEAAPNRKDKKTGQKHSDGNITSYRTTQKRLIEYAESIDKEDFEFVEIDKVFYDGFVEWLQKEGLAANTIGKYIRNLKTFLNDAERNDYYKSKTFRMDFHVHEEEADTVYLNEKELQQIKDTDFTIEPHLEQARDCFLLLCWTGCRFKKKKKMVAENIKDNRVTFRQQKTNTKVVIPLLDTPREILEKYNYDIPQFSNRKFNDYVKEICRRSGINSEESMTRTIGGKRVTDRFEKWEKVSSHTGRRSFASNMYKRGTVPTYTIMMITGHKTEKSFLKYIRISEEEHAQIMEKAWGL